METDVGPIKGLSSTDMVLPYLENEREVKFKKKSQYIIGNGKKVRFVHVWRN